MSGDENSGAFSLGKCNVPLDLSFLLKLGLKGAETLRHRDAVHFVAPKPCPLEIKPRKKCSN